MTSSTCRGWFAITFVPSMNRERAGFRFMALMSTQCGGSGWSDAMLHGFTWTEAGPTDVEITDYHE